MVDARGYLCPMPVVMVQKALEAEHPDTLEVLVDNETAVENIKRFAAHSGYQATATLSNAPYTIFCATPLLPSSIMLLISLVTTLLL